MVRRHGRPNLNELDPLAKSSGFVNNVFFKVLQMNKKLLCVAMLAGLSWAQAASAQEFDDRWYLTGAVGMNVQDKDRNTDDSGFLSLGLGKFISPNWSLDG